MNVSVLELLEDSSISVAFSEYILLPADYSVSNNNTLVNVIGTLTNKRDYYCFEGTLTTNLNFICNKCLKEVEQTVSFHILENFSDNSVEDESCEKDIWSFTGKVIDLKPVVETNLFLNMPAKVVCSDNCKGLCYTCGCDLNNEKICNCNKEGQNIDPRFDCLRSLFHDKEV